MSPCVLASARHCRGRRWATDSRIEDAKPSIRAKVEHPFHVVKNLFGHRKAGYRGLAKNTSQLFSLFGFANLVLARRWLLDPNTQGAS